MWYGGKNDDTAASADGRGASRGIVVVLLAIIADPGLKRIHHPSNSSSAAPIVLLVVSQESGGSGPGRVLLQMELSKIIAFRSFVRPLTSVRSFWSANNNSIFPLTRGRATRGEACIRFFSLFLPSIGGPLLGTFYRDYPLSDEQILTSGKQSGYVRPTQTWFASTIN
jgi:hypothetical protein